MTPQCGRTTSIRLPTELGPASAVPPGSPPFAVDIPPGSASCRVRGRDPRMDNGEPSARCGRMAGLLSAEGRQTPRTLGRPLPAFQRATRTSLRTMHRPCRHPRRPYDATPHPLPDHRRAGTGDPRRRAVVGGDHRALSRSDRCAGATPRRVHGHLPGTRPRAGPRRGPAARGRHRPRPPARHPVRGQGSVRRDGPADPRAPVFLPTTCRTPTAPSSSG